jgi:hypothetical protein
LVAVVAVVALSVALAFAAFGLAAAAAVSAWMLLTHAPPSTPLYLST